MKATRANRFKTWGIPIVFVAAALAAAEIVSHKVDPVEVRADSPRLQDIDNLVTTNGKVIPVSEFQARANFPGIVEKVYVALGDRVKPGQLLVSMKDPFAASRVAAANSVLKSAQVANRNIRQGGSQEERINLTGDLKHAQLEQAEATRRLAALRKLQQQGAASPAEIDAAEQRLDNANATLRTVQQRNTQRFSPGDVSSASARVADAQANLDSARIQFDNANIASPMSGTVYEVQVRDYDFVPMGAELLDVADLNQVQIRAYFDEPEIGQLQAGQAVTVTWDGKPGRIWHGHIKQAPVAAVVLGPRSVGECTILVDDAKGDLLPNTNVMVTVMIQRHLNVLTIPREALYTDGPDHFVFRIVDGRLVRTPIDVGIVNLVRAEVRRGLTPSDTVALNAMQNRELSANLPVRVVR